MKKNEGCLEKVCTGGLTWNLLEYNLRPLAKRKRPYVGDVVAAAYNEDGNIIYVCDCHKPHSLFAITRDYRLLWEINNFDLRSLDYSSVKDTILGYRCGKQEPHSIVEFSAKKGKVLRALTKTALGPIGHPSTINSLTGSVIHYHPADHNKFWVADCEHHAVYCTDWKGKIYYQFGTFGTPGETDKLLKHPASVSPAFLYGGDIMIADWGNNRVLSYDLSGKMTEKLPFPYPLANFINGPTAVFNGANPCHHFYGVFILSDGLTPNPRFNIPMNTNFVVPHPKVAFKFLLSWDGCLYEIDFRDKIYQETFFGSPTQCWLITNMEDSGEERSNEVV